MLKFITKRLIPFIRKNSKIRLRVVFASEANLKGVVHYHVEILDVTLFSGKKVIFNDKTIQITN